ncbi:tetratricopeptide repeat protein [Parasphingorhabdus sp.]|uniref:tetratricopeptide repeat protein n=1 Tax=Parasphingorhabdus sp. TaxID=2709688 RepID=UPI003A8CBD33
MRSLIIWVLSFVIAGLAAFSAVSGVAKNKNPAAAIAMGSQNGLVLASQTQVILQQEIIENNGIVPGSFDASSLTLAKTAFQHEPTAYQAVRFMAFVLASRERENDARKLMQNTVRLTKRDRVANMWFVTDYGEKGDLKSVLHYYDLALRTNAESANLLFPLMAQALTEKKAIDPFKQMLSLNPPWAPDFWHRLARSPDSIENASLLRMAQQKDGMANPADNDAAIIKLLVANGKWEQAHKFFTALTTTRPSNSKAALQNQSFGESSEYPPFDWEIFSSGEYGAVIDDSSGALLVSALPKTQGLVARQLFRMDSGLYGLTVKSTDLEGPTKPLWKVVIRCAEKLMPKDVVLEKLIQTSNIDESFAVPPNPCEFFWIEVSVMDNGQGEGIDLSIRQIAVQKKS